MLNSNETLHNLGIYNLTQRREAAEPRKKSVPFPSYLDEVRRVYECVSDSVFVLDERGYFVYLNGAAWDYCNLPQSRVLGYRPGEVWPDITRLVNNLIHMLTVENITGPVSLSFSAGYRIHCFSAQVHPSKVGPLIVARQMVVENQPDANPAWAFFSEIFDSMPYGFFVLDQEWRFRYANSMITERARPEGISVIGLHYWDVMNLPNDKTVITKIRGVMHGRCADQFEMFNRETGAWLEIAGYPIQNGISVMIRDITWEKIAGRYGKANGYWLCEDQGGEHGARIFSADKWLPGNQVFPYFGLAARSVSGQHQSEIRYPQPENFMAFVQDASGQRYVNRQEHEQMKHLVQMLEIFEASRDAIIIRDENEIITFWNKGAESLYGWKRDEAIGNSMKNLLQSAYSESYQEIEATLLREGHWQGEITQRDRFNTEHIVTSSWSLKRNEAGDKEAVIEVNYDVTQRKYYEAMLTGKEKTLRSMANAWEDMVILLEADGTIVFVNDKYAEYFGLIPEEMNGSCMYDLLSEETSSQVRQGVQNTLLEEKPLRGQKWYGDRFWDYHLCLVPQPSNRNHRVGLFFRDLTAIKKLETEMARLDRLNLVGEMAAGMGHEVRNPLTVVRGLTQILQQRANREDQQVYYDLMIEEIDRANAIITEFLVLAKNRIVHVKESNLADILQKTAPLIYADAISQDKHLIVESSQMPSLFVDEKEIQQLILNLARNGLEAMQAGQTLRIRTYWEGGEAVLAVSDEGPGIHPQLLDKLGTPWMTTKANGVGLGLPVCYSIAARHHARIVVETGSGGTCFYVRFAVPERIK